MRTVLVSVLVTFALLCAPTLGFAQSTTKLESDVPVVEASAADPLAHLTAGERAVYSGLAVVPGIAVHGAGHWFAGDRSTGYKLLAMEGIGLAMIGLGLFSLAITGAASQFVLPTTHLTYTGFGVFIGSFAEDLYGVATPDNGTGSPQVQAPWLEAALGYQYAYNPNFDFGSFAHVGLDGRWKAWRLSPSLWLAMDDENVRVEADAAYRFIGPRPDRTAEDGSYLELETGYAYHNYGEEEGFAEHSVDVLVNTRYDFQRLSESLAGSFMDFAWGIGIQRYVREFGTADSTTITLGGFAWGFYLGHGPDGWGEFALVYDHRHDGFAGGFKFPGVGSGVAGSFGARLDLHVWDKFGIRATTAIGSASVSTLDVVYQIGGSR